MFTLSSGPTTAVSGFSWKGEADMANKQHVKVLPLVSTGYDLVLLKFNFLLEFGTGHQYSTPKCLSVSLCPRICE